MGIASRFLVTKLINKSILRVHGSESLPYLQTFLTNDIRHIAPGSGRHCIYSHIINSMGRSLADVFVYQPIISPASGSIKRNLVLAPFYSEDFGEGGLETDQILIECDKTITDGLRRTLFAMKIRKKVSIEKVDTNQVWVIYPENYNYNSILPFSFQISDNVISVPDPRLSNLAYRIIVPSNWRLKDVQDVVSNSFELSESNMAQYEKYRYGLGIIEGAKENLEGHAFPLECNADLLNGISFKKGLFSGDWITGRNYRKGVEQRIVPFELRKCSQDDLDLIAPETLLLDESNREIGWIRTRRGQTGLASIRCDQLKYGIGTSFIHSLNGVVGEVWIPNWWPNYVEPVKETNIPDGKNNSYIIPLSQR